MKGTSRDPHLSLGRYLARVRYPYLRAVLDRLELWACQEVPQALKQRGAFMWIDGRWRVGYDQAELARLSPDTIAVLLVHLALHGLFGHSGFSPPGPAEEIALELEVNDDLEEDYRRTGEFRPVYPRDLGLPTGRTWAWYAHQLKERGDDTSGLRPRGCTLAPPAPEEVPGTSPEVQEAARNCVTSALLGSAGGPGNLRRWAERYSKRRLDWRRLLRLHLHRISLARSDYSWKKMRRAGDAYLPRLRGYRPEMDVYVDTSASVSEADLGRFLQELDGMLLALGARARVTCADARAYPTQLVTRASQLELVGGGGTNLAQALRECPPRGDLVVVFTDGHTTRWPDPPGVPVIWVLTPDGVEESRIPFGKVVRLKEEG